MSPEAMRAMRQLAQTTPTRIDIALTDSLVTVTYAAASRGCSPSARRSSDPSTTI